MIKLIVCDVDGTLLPHGRGQVDREIIDLAQTALNSGIAFAVASGRTYTELKKLFDFSDLFYIPSDGAALIYRDKILFRASILSFSVEKLLVPLVGTQNLAAVACGKDISYIMGENAAEKIPVNISEALSGSAVKVRTAGEIREDVYKLSFYGEAKSFYGKKLLSGTADSLTKIVYQKGGITEFVSAYAGKEKAVLRLMGLLKLNRDEIAAVGDGENDAGMLALTENSFAVKGGNEKALKASAHITENVQKTIENIIRKGEIYDVL